MRMLIFQNDVEVYEKTRDRKFQGGLKVSILTAADVQKIYYTYFDCALHLQYDV